MSFTSEVKGREQLSVRPKSNLHLRSESAQEIISRRPSFLERWTIYSITFMILLLIGLSSLIRYPDIVSTGITLTADNAPKEIITRSSGHLLKLLVQNNNEVKKGDIIGLIECSADHSEIMKLSKQIDKAISCLENDKITEIPNLLKYQFRNLGELQDGYRQLTLSLQQFDDYMVNGFYIRKRNFLKEDIKSLKRIKDAAIRQFGYMSLDSELAVESFDMNERLLKEKVIAQEQFRNEKSKFIAKQIALPQTEVSIISNENLERDKFKEINQIDHDYLQQKVLFSQALNSIKSAISEWQLKYVIQAPTDGHVFFTIPLQQNQFLNSNLLLGYINPPNNRIYVDTYLPQVNFGKLDTGLSVHLRLDAFPYQEFGELEGKISYISNIPSDSGFLAHISLTHDMVTNTNRKIMYKNGLKGQGLILTKEHTLLQRLYYTIIKSQSAMR